MFRSVSVVQALVLVIIGVIVGAVLDAAILPTAHGMSVRSRPPSRVFTARDRDPYQFRLDSVAGDSLAKRIRVLRRTAPVEVRRIQALNNCAVSFVFRDTAYRALRLFSATAWDRLAPGTLVSRGMTYSDKGFGLGDTATVVLPNVYCRDIIVASFGGSPTLPQSLFWAR
jgi:hypothetical protein